MRLRRCDPPGKGLLDSEKLLKIRFPEPKHFFILGVAGETRGLRLSSDWKYDDAYGLGCRVRQGPMRVLFFSWPLRPEGSDDILHRAPQYPAHGQRSGRVATWSDCLPASLA
jgi:hypothetical protein